MHTFFLCDYKKKSCLPQICTSEKNINTSINLKQGSVYLNKFLLQIPYAFIFIESSSGASGWRLVTVGCPTNGRQKQFLPTVINWRAVSCSAIGWRAVSCYILLAGGQ